MLSAGRPWAGSRSASGRRRKEDHALGVPGPLEKVADHGRSPSPAVLGSGNRRPHPLIELAAELLDQPFLLFGHLRIPLGEQDVSMTGLEAEQLHGPDYASGATAQRPSVDARAVREPEHVDRPRAGAHPPQTPADR